MQTKMTLEQQALFIKIMQFGNAVGLHDRFLCLQTYIRANPLQATEALDAALAYERGCGFSHEATEKLAEMTNDSFRQFVVEYCRNKRKTA